jgi:hypothetical protein
MRAKVKMFVNKCRIFQYAKERQQNTGLYQPLPIPKSPWDAIRMDFIFGFPKTQKGNDSIFVVVDKFSKIIPCQKKKKKKNDSTGIANLFFREVVRLHGFPRSIVSDRDTKSVGHFWRTLWKRMGTNLSFSSAKHPQIDGKTEEVNKSIGNLLRSLVIEQGYQWDHMLAQVEFSFNNLVNKRTGKSPFEIVYSIQPRGITEFRYLNQDEFRSFGAEYFATEMQKLHDRVRCCRKISLRTGRLPQRA